MEITSYTGHSRFYYIISAEIKWDFENAQPNWMEITSYNYMGQNLFEFYSSHNLNLVVVRDQVGLLTKHSPNWMEQNGPILWAKTSSNSISIAIIPDPKLSWSYI